MKVLIGYDGSQCSQDAITDLQRAGLPSKGTEAMVFAVWDSLPLPGGSEVEAAAAPGGPVILRDVQRYRAAAMEALERTRQDAARQAQQLQELFPGWSVKAEARADAPHWALVGMAAEWDADLIVVGSHGRSTLGRLVLGSVSQQVLQHAPCSVRIGNCRPRDASRPERVQLVLGIDGSADSQAAVSAVAARHWPAASEVLVVGVLDSRIVLKQLQPDPSDGTRSDLQTEPLTDLERPLASACDTLSRAGIVATPRLLVGDPKKLLIEEAERVKADCIVVGAKGHTRLERLMLGSVSASVAARAACSVEVVRTAPGERRHR